MPSTVTMNSQLPADIRAKQELPGFSDQGNGTSLLFLKESRNDDYPQPF
jgi:hypothetical protein